MLTYSQKSAKVVMQRQNPYLNTDYNNLYNFNPKEKTFSNTKCAKIKSYATQARPVAQNNQKTKRILKIKITKAKILDINPFINQSNYKVLKRPKYTSKTETETATKNRSVIGIKILLNTISITSQNKGERNQKSSSKQNANVTPLLIKGTWPLKPSQWAHKI